MNTDPFQVLGIPKTADEAAIRVAYIKLVRACHPDQYAGQPMEHDAAERLKEINRAYDTLSKKITPMRGRHEDDYKNTSDPIEEMIRAGQLEQALTHIDALPHSARRCYLLGLLRFRMGELEGAEAQFRQAVDLDPRPAYKAALRQAQAVVSSQPWYRRFFRRG